MAHSAEIAVIDSKIFDYVIVGGGTAGLVLASRLTEDPDVQDPKINIPGLMTELYEDPNYDWGFKTAPQPNLNNRTIAWPRGKVLGGTSAINFLMVSHASRVDLDNWEKIGNPGWNFDTLQPYYRKSETFNTPTAETVKELGIDIIDISLHGASGPIQTSFSKDQGPLDQAWGLTFQTMGLGPRSDPRAGDSLGGYSLPKFMDEAAKRSYAASAYYFPNSRRSNLTILTGAMREVILSAGTVQSPQLLELSGIGNKTQLQLFGIDVVVENPGVRENLQDHPLLGFAYEAIEGIPTREMIKQPGVLDWAIQEYKQKGAGPLAGGVTGSAFLSSSSTLAPGERETFATNLSRLAEEYSSSLTSGLRKQIDLQKELLLNEDEADIQYNFGATGGNPQAGEAVATLFDHKDPEGYSGIVTVLTLAFSRGTVHIQGPDVVIPPIIDPHYMDNPLDIKILARGLLQVISEAAPLSGLLKDNESGDGKKIQPSFLAQGRLTKEEAVRIVRESMSSSFYLIGTCSMLPKEDGGVVDSSLRVYGTRNLKVVDASIFPLNVRGNIASLVYAVAERASDLIKSEKKWQGQHV